MVAARQEHTIHPIYVVHGSDRRRVADEVAALTERILADADVQVALSSYDGATAELAEVTDDLRTLPFLSPRRLVVVKQADEFIKRYRRELEEYLESPCATGVLLLMAESFAATMPVLPMPATTTRPAVPRTDSTASENSAPIRSASDPIARRSDSMTSRPYSIFVFSGVRPLTPVSPRGLADDGPNA